jgi:hypothetical protein
LLFRLRYSASLCLRLGKQPDEATALKVIDIQGMLPEGQYSAHFLATCLTAYGGDEQTVVNHLLDGTLPPQLKRICAQEGAVAVACMHTYSSCACMHAHAVRHGTRVRCLIDQPD